MTTVNTNPKISSPGIILKLQVSSQRTNVASVGSVFNDTRKVKALSLPETIKEKPDFSFIVSGSERTFTFRVVVKVLLNNIIFEFLYVSQFIMCAF